MFGLGVPELMVILVIALVIFGPSKLPQIGSGLGKAIRDFKKGVTENNDDEAAKEAKKANKGVQDRGGFFRFLRGWGREARLSPSPSQSRRRLGVVL